MAELNDIFANFMPQSSWSKTSAKVHPNKK